MNAPFRVLTLALARALAQAHADAGLQQFNALQGVAFQAKQKPDTLGYLEHVQHAIPAATSLALAAELFLKVLHFQHFLTYPRDHDLVALYALLPSEMQKKLRSAYSESIARDLPLEVVHFGLAVGFDGTSVPDVDMPNVDSIDDAIAHLRDVFLRWRYLYETMETPAGHGIHFKALLCLIESLRQCVDQYDGGGKVTVRPSTRNEATVV